MWHGFGIATDETCEVLAAQLGLKAGEGLAVVYVEPNSPAAKRVFKNRCAGRDGRPGAVHPGQLRKLVRRQKEGNSIKLEFYESERSNQSQRHLARRTIVPMQTTRCLMWSRIS